MLTVVLNPSIPTLANVMESMQPVHIIDGTCTVELLPAQVEALTLIIIGACALEAQGTIKSAKTAATKAFRALAQVGLRDALVAVKGVATIIGADRITTGL